MSRIGKLPVNLPAGVTVEVAAGNVVKVKGPLGQLSQKVDADITVTVEANVVNLTRPTDLPRHRSLHGLTRTLIANMVEGVTNGYSKTLEIEGVGYRAAKKGKEVVLSVGFSHPVNVPETDDIKLDVPQPNTIVVSGIDKQAVGQYAAEIREKRPPEPYKGKGIRYENEHIIRKEGKAGKGKK